MNRTQSLTVAAFLTAWMSTALADEREQAFKERDVDRNGIVDRQEAQTDPNLQVYFGRADTDADGGVSLREYQIFAADLARARRQEEVPAE